MQEMQEALLSKFKTLSIFVLSTVQSALPSGGRKLNHLRPSGRQKSRFLGYLDVPKSGGPKNIMVSWPLNLEAEGCCQRYGRNNYYAQVIRKRAAAESSVKSPSVSSNQTSRKAVTSMTGEMSAPRSGTDSNYRVWQLARGPLAHGALPLARRLLRFAAGMVASIMSPMMH